MISETRWLEVLTSCGVRASTAVVWAPLFTRHVQADRFSAGDREIDDFVGQVLHETGRLEHLVENLNYSADNIRRVGNQSPVGSRWRSLVPLAEKLARNPEALANAAYGGRMGNDTNGDGWRFRGGGIPMVTGRDNYALLASLTGLPLLDHPELLREPETALQCALLWWERKVPDSAIDSVERVTRAVQGGSLALDDRRWLTVQAGEALA